MKALLVVLIIAVVSGAITITPTRTTHGQDLLYLRGEFSRLT
jgi:hypothetical protein